MMVIPGPDNEHIGNTSAILVVHCFPDQFLYQNGLYCRRHAISVHEWYNNTVQYIDIIGTLW